MKFGFYALFISLVLLTNTVVSAQQERVKIEDFITEHQGLKKMMLEKSLR